MPLLQPVPEPMGQSRRWTRKEESLYVGVAVVAQRPPDPPARSARRNRTSHGGS